MKLALPITALAATAAAKVGIMVPLYEYPLGAALDDWQALVDAVKAHPGLDFYVIINNGNGAPYDTNPPANTKDWAHFIGELNNHTNVKTVGYIATTHSTRIQDTINKGIDQYAEWTTFAAWPEGTTGDIHIDGIFFDEIDTDPKFLSYNKAIANHAKTKFGTRGGPIILNPGTAVNKDSLSLFESPDIDAIVDIETCYTTVEGARDASPDGGKTPGPLLCDKSTHYKPFTPASLDDLPAQYPGKSAVLVHDFYDDWWPNYQPASLSTLETDIKAIVSNKAVHSFYISQYAYRLNFTATPASIANVTRLAAEAQGVQ